MVHSHATTGYMLRALLALSNFSGRPLSVTSIRTDEPAPGLNRQDVDLIHALCEFMGSDTVGAHEGSTNLTYVPGTEDVSGLHLIHLDPQTSTVDFLLTTFLRCASELSPTTLVVKGGTHLPNSYSAEYLEVVAQECLRNAGITVAFHAPVAGFGTSLGEMHMHIAPSLPNRIKMLDKGDVKDITLYLTTSRWTGAEVAQLVAAYSTAFGSVPHRLNLRTRDSEERGAAVLVSVETELGGRAGMCATLSDPSQADQKARDARREAEAWVHSPATVGDFLAQILVPLSAACARGGEFVVMSHNTYLQDAVQLISKYSGRHIHLSESGYLSVAGEFDVLNLQRFAA